MQQMVRLVEIAIKSLKEHLSTKAAQILHVVDGWNLRELIALLQNTVFYSMTYYIVSNSGPGV